MAYVYTGGGILPPGRLPTSEPEPTPPAPPSTPPVPPPVLDFAAACVRCGASVMQATQCDDEAACAQRALFRVCDKVFARLGWLGVDWQDDRTELRDSLDAARAKTPTPASTLPSDDNALAARLYEESCRRLGSGARSWGSAANSEKRLWLVLADVVRDLFRPKPAAEPSPIANPYAVCLDNDE